MFAKSTTLLVLAALAARLVVATPPACMIAAVNTQPNPGALQAVCSGSNATAVVESICKNCSSNAAAALSAFASVCSGAGVTIELNLVLHNFLFLLLRLDDQQRIRDWLSWDASDSHWRLIGFDWYAHGYGHGRDRQRDSDRWAEWKRHTLYPAGFGAERNVGQWQWQQRWKWKWKC
ncbi:hypothetical protein LTR48_004578 [Friedmanniomyces endolithicus]|uniref:Uncharacterized protein n=1 Tax=Rachicladosporium monterosium TaxID=1507873 RepID=A0ABR0L6U3_9PEZI|nr:hypothetical protein LTR29_005004 [Friedmanniomyces endolithicus]KAK1085412.1 hypothetical protein LTR48_004578 [Friedmanniomyces endolithicus]KAK5143534.1 hypothetical protein LTR32_004356 [Rachicladosporium monterosium]